MSAYVPGHDHDVFVSYAHVNDQALAGADEGWVTTLVSNLKKMLAQKLEHGEAKFWMDFQLPGNVPLTPHILGELERTATLLVIFSTRYATSEWCKKEWKAFLELVRKRVDSGSRVFLIEYDKVELENRPAELSDLRGYRFWTQGTKDPVEQTLGSPALVPSAPDYQEYYKRLSNVAHDMAAELKRIKGASAIAAPAPAVAAAAPSDAPQRLVYLAEVTDDLEQDREELRGFLDQHKIGVRPDATIYPSDPDAFRSAVEADLGACQLYVQLLGPFSGKRPAGMPAGFPGAQFDIARKLGKPVLQWRSRDLDLSKVGPPEYQKLLEPARAEGIELFKEAVLKEATAVQPFAPADDAEPFIFVHAKPEDRLLAEAIGVDISRYNVEYALPAGDGAEQDLQADVQAKLLGCDGLILVYGSPPSVWVHKQLWEVKKIFPRREPPLLGVALYDGPPKQKGDLGFRLRYMTNLDCREGPAESQLRTFIEGVKARFAQRKAGAQPAVRGDKR